MVHRLRPTNGDKIGTNLAAVLMRGAAPNVVRRAQMATAVLYELQWCHAEGVPQMSVAILAQAILAQVCNTLFKLRLFFVTGGVVLGTSSLAIQRSVLPHWGE